MSTRTLHQDHQKAESILHHLLRLGSKVTNPIKKRRRRRFWKKQLRELRRQQASMTSVATPTTFTRGSSVFCSLQISESCFDEDDTQSPSDELVPAASIEKYNKLKTIDQNDLLAECFMGKDDTSDSAYAIHFFDEDSTISDDIDNFLETRLLLVNDDSSCTHWKCRRVNTRRAPFFARILDIDPEQPTVVAIKDGIMVSKQTEFSSNVEPQLQRWMTATESILSGEEDFLDDFDFDDDAYSSEEEEDDF